MIKWFFKYGFVLYLLNTVLLSIGSTFDLGSSIFLFIMALFSLLILLNLQQIRLIIFHKAFSSFLIINILNVIYFLLFHSFSDYEAGKFLLARGIQFSIISFAIIHNYNYFKQEFLMHLVYTILGIIVLGLIIDPFIFAGRYSGIVWNPNMLASLTSIAFAVLLISQKQRTKFDLFLLAFLLIISLSTGSRGILVAISLAYLFKYGFSIRNIMYALFALVSYFVLVNIQLDTSVSRFESQGLLNNRLLQYQYAYETFLQKPLFGFGLDRYSYINPELVPYDHLHGHNQQLQIIGAHNGYLAILVQYGFIFGLVIIGLIFYKTTQFYFRIDKEDSVQLSYLYIIVYALIASFYESMMTGINEFHTVLFWFSFGFLSYSIYKKEYEN